ncbi:MAG TPA: NAD(P)/FAD-dependent oxidoreductase [Clostridiaceae bacterium]|nr:NAD(P)/FAD-dependent oxidoreductase [Clostridiaceae bacterium]
MTDKKSKVRVNKTEEAAFYDVVIIGAGVTGAFIARELSKYEASVCLVEKEADVAMGSSKANSAIVHAGYDAEPGSLKARLNVEGNLLMPGVAEELGVPYKNTGSLVVAFSESEAELLGNLMERGRINGVKGLEIIAKDTLQKIEPSISADATAALYAPTAGIVCPYELTIGAVENAVENGVEVKLETEVTGIAFAGDLFEVSTNRGKLFARFVVNAAGLYADKIAGMIGDNSFSIHPRKGEYLLLDKSQGGIVNRVVFQVPNDKGKGILVTPTVDGNLLVGPNAEDIDDKEDAGTTLEGLREVMEKARKSVPGINYREVVTSFSGLRARPTGGDFIIGVSKKNQRFINVAGIESPGLTAAPATGPYVAGILKEQGFALNKKENFNPVRKPAICTRTMKAEELNALIKKDPGFGRIVCRCEKVTEGEIVESIHRPCGAKTLDAVKRRTRAGMGRCQGGFCSPRVVEILSRELGIPMHEVTKMGENSEILAGKLKQVKIHKMRGQ